MVCSYEYKKDPCEKRLTLFQLLDKLPKVRRICRSNVFHILYEVKKLMWFT